MKILSPAKINLFLQVTGKRPDGYHDLFSLMCCVSLYDEIFLEFGVGEIQVRCSDSQVPQDGANLAHKAASLYLSKLHKSEGVKISIQKRIPVAAGLGGGSSNAASVLLGLNHHYQHPFTKSEMMSMGLSIGADVPFFIFGNPALATGIGEKLESYPGLLPYHVLLIHPGMNVSTAEVYRNLNLGLTKCKKKFTNTPFSKFDFNIAHHLCNDLETVTVSSHPDILTAKEKLMQNGALGALMSGSGPTVFGLFSDADTTRNAMHILSQNKRWKMYPAQIIVDAAPNIIRA